MVGNEKINKPTHCVVMVTYNHEKWIRMALESIFDNTVLPNKVIICDDCSTDATWGTVLEFKSKYSDIIDCYRNEKNLGIFQNINKSYVLGIESGCDIISDLSGDDYLKKGLFEELNRVVFENNIDVYNDKFIIVTNTEELYPDGQKKTVDNYHLRKETDLTYYRVLGKLSYREIGLSRNVLKDIPLYRYDLGLMADLLFCMSYEQKCNKFYFTPFVSTGYRVNIGTVSKERKEVLKKSRFEVEKIVLQQFELSNRTKKHLKHSICMYEYNLAVSKYKAKEAGFPILLHLKCFGLKKIIKLFIPYGIVMLYNTLKKENLKK